MLSFHGRKPSRNPATSIYPIASMSSTKVCTVHHRNKTISNTKTKGKLKVEATSTFLCFCIVCIPAHPLHCPSVFPFHVVGSSCGPKVTKHDGASIVKPRIKAFWKSNKDVCWFDIEMNFFHCCVEYVHGVNLLVEKRRAKNPS